MPVSEPVSPLIAHNKCVVKRADRGLGQPDVLVRQIDPDSPIIIDTPSAVMLLEVSWRTCTVTHTIGRF